MVLETQRTRLRPFESKDLQDLYEYSSQAGVGEMAGWRPHATKEESRAVLEENMKTPCVFAIELKENAKVIGHIAVHADSENGRADTKELGFVLSRGHQRRGIMTEVVQKMVEQLFAGGVKHVYACCFQENLPSRKLIERCGFRFERQGTFYSPSLGKTFRSFEYVRDAPG